MTLTTVQLSTVHNKVTELLINAIITPHLHLPDALTPEEIKKAKAIDQTMQTIMSAITRGYILKRKH